MPSGAWATDGIGLLLEIVVTYTSSRAEIVVVEGGGLAAARHVQKTPGEKEMPGKRVSLFTEQKP